jgi:hypothetical protein
MHGAKWLPGMPASLSTADNQAGVRSERFFGMDFKLENQILAGQQLACQLLAYQLLGRRL